MRGIKNYPLKKIIETKGDIQKLECGHELPMLFYENVVTGEMEPGISVRRRCYLCPKRNVTTKK